MSDWCGGKLSDLISHHTGGGTPTRNVDAYWNGDIPWASVKDFCAGQKKLTSTQEAITIRGLQASASNLIPANTVLICSRMAVGRVAITAQPTAINQDVKALFPEEGISADYLYYLLAYCENYFASIAVGSTVKGISTGQILDKTVSFPSSGVARDKIAQILDTLDTTIRETESIIAKLQAVKQGLLHDLLTRGLDANGQLRPPPALAPHFYKDSPLGLIPREWEVTHLKQLAETITSGSRGWATYYANEGALFVRIGNLTREHINFRWDDKIFVKLPANTEGSRTALVEGDLLISITADLGIVAVVPTDFTEAYINQHIALVRILPHHASSRFVGHYLSSQLGQEQFQKLNDGGAKAGLNLPTIAALQTILPKQEEQTMIVVRLDTCDAQIADQKQMLQKQEELKSGLMDDLLSGRVRVKVAETEGA